MSKRELDFLRAIEHHVISNCGLERDDALELLALARRGAGPGRQKAAAEIERARAAEKAALDLAERHMNEKHRLRAALENIAEMTKPEVRTGAKARPYAEQNVHFLARAALTAQPAEGEK